MRGGTPGSACDRVDGCGHRAAGARMGGRLGRLARHDITGPFVFAVAGYVLANPDWGPLTVDVDAASVHLIAEITLALVLFSDAARVNLAELRRDARSRAAARHRSRPVGGPRQRPRRGGSSAASRGRSPASSAQHWRRPTPRSSVQVINDERIPLRLRRALNVESGLNDGIATPIVVFMLAVSASQLGLVTHSVPAEAGAALRELGGGVITGIVVGVGGAVLISSAAPAGWMMAAGPRLATVAVAVAAFTSRWRSTPTDSSPPSSPASPSARCSIEDVVDLEEAAELPELGGELLALVVWFLFGATLVPLAFEDLDGRTVAYALGQPDGHPHAPGRGRASWAPDSIGPASCSSAGSDHADSPRWCSPCWPSRTSAQPPPRSGGPSPPWR